MSIETRLRETGPRGGGGGGSSNSGGLVGSGGLFAVYSASPLLPNSRILTAGTNITLSTDATSIFISALTGSGASSSAGLMGTGNYLIVGSAQPGLPGSRILTAGSSITMVTDATAFYITAITNTFAGSGGLVGTGNLFAVYSASPLLPFSRIITAGSSISLRTDTTALYIDALTGGAAGASAGLAGTGPFYLLHTSGNSTLPLSKLLSAGNNISLTTDAVAMFITATTGVAPGTGGLMGTGGFFVAWSSDTTMSNERVLTAGSSVTLVTDGTTIWINAITSLGAGTANTTIGTGGFMNLPVQSAKLYANTSAARIDAGTPFWRLLFSATTQQYGVWQFTLPYDYSGSPATQLIFSSDSSLSVAKSVQWLVDEWGISNSQNSIYVDTFAGANSTTVALSAGYSAGLVQIITVPLALTNSFAAGNLIKLRVSSSAGSITGNQELVGLGLFYRAGTQVIATGSGGLAGTGNFFVSYLADPALVNEKILTAGSSVTIHTDSTSIYINATTSVGASSAGLAGTGPFYLLHTSGNGTLPLSKFISAGNNITITTDATSVLVSATTGAAAASGGLMSTGGFFVGWSSDTTMSNEKVLTAGSSVTLHTDATAIYINATTSGGSSNSGGLMGTGGLFLAWSSDTTMSNEKVFTAGTNVVIRTTATAFIVDAPANGYEYWYSARSNQYITNRTRMYIASQVNATALGATVIPINSACFVAFVPTKDLKIDTMGTVATIAGSATSLLQLGIFTNSADSVLYPFQSVSTSGVNISATNTTLVGFNPATTLSANQLYWFGFLSIKSAVTLRTIAVGGAQAIFGMGTDLSTAPGLYLQVGVNPSNGFSADYSSTTGNIITTAVPALAVRVSI